MTGKYRKEQYVLEIGYDRETDLPRVMTIKSNGMLQSPPDGRPSFVRFNEQGRPSMMEWHEADDLHNERGPSRVWINPENGVEYEQEFHLFGEAPIDQKKPRKNPALIRRDKETGEVVETLYFTGKSMLKGPNPPGVS